MVEGVGGGLVDESENGNGVVVVAVVVAAAAEVVVEYDTDERGAVDVVGVFHVDGHTLADLDIP